MIYLNLQIVSSPKDSIKYLCSLKAKGHITSDLVRTIDQDNDVQLVMYIEYKCYIPLVVP